MVNIDTVYQRVLALANKEQRGYITPQEFNLFANQAQLDIFEQYFYDINQFGRIPGNDTEYSDMLNYLEEKISIFEDEKNVNKNTTGTFYNISNSIGSSLYKIGSITYNGYVCEKVNANHIHTINRSPLLKPRSYSPIYTLKESKNKLYLYPESLEDPILVNYIRKPEKANWSSYTLSGSQLYDSTNSVDFELHPSEETKLVIKILSLAGITLKDPALYQIAGTEDNKNIQQEKQ
tara:strand:+ start:3459 stop:4163 length:705 start_codon:yes stop_codon:yes gene_type:complete